MIPLQSNTGPAGWQADLSQAVTDKANAVVMLCGPSAAAIAPQLATLKSDHIPVIDGNYNQTGGNPSFPTTGLDAESGVNTVQGVETDFADALVNLKGKPAKILFLDSPQVAQYSGAYGGLQAAIKTYCPGSLLDRQGRGLRHAGLERPEGDRGGHVRSAGQPEHQHRDRHLRRHDRRHRERGSGRRGHATPGLKMYAWGGGLAEIKDVQSSSTFVGDSGPDEKWDAYNQLDQTIRLLAGKPAAPVAKEVAPNIFFTKTNAKIFSVGGNGQAYSDQAFSNGAFVNDFLKLWGVKK